MMLILKGSGDSKSSPKWNKEFFRSPWLIYSLPEAELVHQGKEEKAVEVTTYHHNTTSMKYTVKFWKIWLRVTCPPIHLSCLLKSHHLQHKRLLFIKQLLFLRYGLILQEKWKRRYSPQTCSQFVWSNAFWQPAMLHYYQLFILLPSLPVQEVFKNSEEDILSFSLFAKQIRFPKNSYNRNDADSNTPNSVPRLLSPQTSTELQLLHRNLHLSINTPRCIFPPTLGNAPWDFRSYMWVIPTILCDTLSTSSVFVLPRTVIWC